MSSAYSPGSPGWGMGTKAVSPGAPSHRETGRDDLGKSRAPLATHALPWALSPGLPGHSRPESHRACRRARLPRLARDCPSRWESGETGLLPGRPLLSSPEQQGRMKRPRPAAPFLPRGDPPCCALSPREPTLPAGLSQALAADIQMDAAPRLAQASLLTVLPPRAVSAPALAASSQPH